MVTQLFWAPSRRFVSLLCFGVLFLGIVACGSGSSSAPPSATGGEVNPAGDIPDNQVFVTFTPPGGVYAIDVPEGWARSGGGAHVSFTDKLNTVTIDQRAASKAPTPTTASAAVEALGANQPGFAMGQASVVQRQSGDAVLVTYQITSAPDPVTGKTVDDDVERYAFWRNGVEVDVTLSGPHGADNVDPWQIITDSFRWR